MIKLTTLTTRAARLVADIAGMYVVAGSKDVLTGFLDADSNALGRPVGAITDHDGALLVADDAGNIIWRVAPDSRTN